MPCNSPYFGFYLLKRKLHICSIYEVFQALTSSSFLSRIKYFIHVLSPHIYYTKLSEKKTAALTTFYGQYCCPCLRGGAVHLLSTFISRSQKACFRQSKKDSWLSCLFWRRYFFLWGVAKTI